MTMAKAPAANKTAWQNDRDIGGYCIGRQSSYFVPCHVTSLPKVLPIYYTMRSGQSPQSFKVGLALIVLNASESVRL